MTSATPEDPPDPYRLPAPASRPPGPPPHYGPPPQSGYPPPAGPAYGHGYGYGQRPAPLPPGAARPLQLGDRVIAFILDFLIVGGLWSAFLDSSSGRYQGRHDKALNSQVISVR